MKIISMAIRGNLHQQIDLNKLHIPSSRFWLSDSCGYLSLGGHVNACIASSGLVRILGCTDPSMVQQLWNDTMSTLKSTFNLPDADESAQIVSITASETLSYALDLEQIKEQFPENTVSETFSGLIWNLESGRCILHSSGDVIVYGADSMENCEKVIAELCQKMDGSNN